MKKYMIAIEETVVEEFEVEANNFDEALNIAAKKYYDGEFVVSPGEVQFKQMSVASPNSEYSDWIEF